MTYLIFFGAEIIGYVLIRYSRWVVDHTFRSAFFESFLGNGGTYTAAKLLGVAFMAFGFYWIFQ